jgi:hypothetical protein
MLPNLKDIKNKRMMMIYRRGIVGNNEDGTPLLINDSGEGYRVSATAISLWNMCNGITFQEFLYDYFGYLAMTN